MLLSLKILINKILHYVYLPLMYRTEVSIAKAYMRQTKNVFSILAKFHCFQCFKQGRKCSYYRSFQMIAQKCRKDNKITYWLNNLLGEIMLET